MKIIKNQPTKSKLYCSSCNINFTTKRALDKHLKCFCKVLNHNYNNIYNFDKNTFGKNKYKDYEYAGDIYIIRNDFANDNIYKIGISNNIKKRISQYRCGSTYEPILYYYFPCKNIKEMDQIIKVALNIFHIKREIFAGDLDNIKNIICNEVTKFNNELCYPIEPDMKEINIYECDDCEQICYDKLKLYKHYEICKNRKEKTEDSKNKSILKQIYKCVHCNNSFSTSSNLKRHVKSRCAKQRESNRDKAEEINSYKKMILIMKEKLTKKDEQISKILNFIKLNKIKITHNEKNITITSEQKLIT